MYPTKPVGNCFRTLWLAWVKNRPVSAAMTISMLFCVPVRDPRFHWSASRSEKSYRSSFPAVLTVAITKSIHVNYFGKVIHVTVGSRKHRLARLLASLNPERPEQDDR